MYRDTLWKCTNCGKEFLSKKACSTRTPKFCSRYCASVRLRKIKICEYCKKEYYNWQNDRFCSTRCCGKSRIGNKLSTEHIKKLSEAKQGLELNERSNKWKGEDVGYGALHQWVRRRKGKPTICCHCGGKAQHWANTDHEYKRILNDFISLCTSCHKKYDTEFLKHRYNK